MFLNCLVYVPCSRRAVKIGALIGVGLRSLRTERNLVVC